MGSKSEKVKKMNAMCAPYMRKGSSYTMLLHAERLRKCAGLGRDVGAGGLFEEPFGVE